MPELAKPSAERRLEEIGLTLPPVPPPAGNYAHAVRSGSELFLAAKGSIGTIGKVGADVSIEAGYQAAREVGLILIAVMRVELGSLDRVRRIVKLFGMVNADPSFSDHPRVINGCSDLMVEVFGERGRHARSAVGMGSLPGQVAVAIDAVVEVED